MIHPARTSRTRLAHVLTAAAAGLACSAAAAQPPEALPLLSHLPGIEIPVTGIPEATVRENAVAVNPAALPDPAAAEGAPLALDLFPDLSVAGTIESVELGASGAVLYRGRINGRPGGSFILAAAEDVVVGEVRLGLGGLFELRALPAEAGGAHVVRQIDESGLPPCATGPEHAVHAPDDGFDHDALRGEATHVFDVLVLYTPQARSGAGGRAAMEALIDIGVSNTNISYTNSNINARANLVYTGVVDYTETGNASTELSRFRNTSDGHMDAVHCLRDAYGADFCALIVNSFDACGIGYLMSNPSTNFASSAFSVTARGCLSSYTFAHELGHNQGSHHDRDNAGSSPAYSYSYGYRTPNNQFRTVMSYSPGTRIPYFSSPLVSYLGHVLGIPEGQANSADNARSIRNVAPIVSQFRPTRPVLYPIERVSHSSSGVQANLDSGLDRLAVSDNGAVIAYTSLANNLDAIDTNALSDLYVSDRGAGTTVCHSIAGGASPPPAGGGYNPSMDGIGRRLVFSSDAANLVTGDTNNHRDIFLRDRNTNTTLRISVGPGGVQASGPSDNPVIARTALIAAFESTADNLHFAGGNGLSNIFVRLLSTSATARVTNGLGGAHPDGPSFRPHLSADGRFVVFESEATNLVPGGTAGHRHIYLHDRNSQQTWLVSVSGTGQPANGPSFNARVSDDGRYIAFESDATNLVAGDSNNARDVFIHDRQTGATRRASVSTTGAQLPLASAIQDLSADGRFVAFTTASNTVVPGITNPHADLFVRDTPSRSTRRVSFNWLGTQYNGPVLTAAISATGRYTVFATTAQNAFPCDANQTGRDVMVVDLGAPGPAPCAADFDANGAVTSADITAFLSAWLDSVAGLTHDGDFNGDGLINSGDITAFLSAWLAGVGGGC